MCAAAGLSAITSRCFTIPDPRTPSVPRTPPSAGCLLQMQTYGDPPGDIVEEMTGGAGRDLTSALANADADEGPSQPSLEELNGQLNNCKMQ